MKRWLPSLRRPTLVRRVVGALVLAFMLVAAVLVGIDYLQFRHVMARSPGIKSVAEAMVKTLSHTPDARDAALVVSAGAEQMNRQRRGAGMLPGDLLFQLRRLDGSLVHASPGLVGTRLAVEAGQVAVLDIAGQRHWAVHAAEGPWRLYVAEPCLTDAEAIRLIDTGLLASLLLAFPLVLLPLCIAVARGMRPLSELADRVSARDAHDLSPLGIVPRHEELKPLVAAFDGLLAQLRQHVQRERAFVQDAAHELRTPMAVIAAQAHVLAHTPDPDERQQAGSALDQALDRASHLSRQLLDLAALDHAHPSQRQVIDVAQLVQKVLARAAPQGLALGLELSLDAPERLPCRLDSIAFESVLQNLLDNALRYVPANGRIAVSLREADGRLTMTVADDGHGIAPAQRERAFERFWRGDTHDHVTGSGLGLAIVQQAATRLGGHVRIEDGLDGRGVAFVLAIPIER